uniref:Uncharacterized protein n=1 Tax=viral metagenome TaxID=1070528 RepID=A0A6C0CP13_9ZZZZ
MVRDLISFGIIFILSLVGIKNKYVGSFISILIALFVIYNTIINKRLEIENNIFVIAKGVSVLLPLLIYANYYYFKDKITLPGIFFTSLMVLNLLEVSFLVQFKCSETLSYINGIFVTILALYTPIFKYDKRLSLYLYDNHWFWSISSSIMLSVFYLFNNFYSLTRYVKLLIFSIVMPTIYSFISGDTKLWLPLRFFSLAFIFAIVSNNYLTTLVTNNEHITDYTSDKYNNLRLIGTFINFLCTIYLIKGGISGTFLSTLIS